MPEARPTATPGAGRAIVFSLPSNGSAKQLADFLTTHETSILSEVIGELKTRLEPGQRPPEAALLASARSALEHTRTWLLTGDPKGMYGYVIDTCRRRLDQGFDMAYLVSSSRLFRDVILKAVLRNTGDPALALRLVMGTCAWSDSFTDAVMSVGAETVTGPWPSATKAPNGEPPLPLDPGYLYHAPDAAEGFRVFSKLVRQGSGGLIVSPDHPKRIREVTGLDDVPVLWLTTNRVHELDTINPTSVLPLLNTIVLFIENSPGSVVLLHGLDFLVGRNTPDRVRTFVQVLKEKLIVTTSKVIVATTGKTESFQEWSQLIAEMKPLPRFA